MANKEFEIDDLVWAKMKSYPDWPARISHPPSIRKGQHWVFFFGTENFSWIKDENIKHHSEEMLEKLSKRKLAGYEEGIEQIKAEHSKKLKKKVEKSISENRETSRQESAKRSLSNFSKSTPKRPIVVATKIPQKQHLEKEDEDTDAEVDNPAPKLAKPYKRLLESVLPSMGRDSTKIQSNQKSAVVRIPSEKIDVEEVPTWSKTIGFLGLGLMGQGMVRNLLKAGYTVTIWNRNHEKCDQFVEEGAKKASTVAEVIRNSDITFSCVSDPHAVRSIVLGEDGVCKGMENCKRGTKGYVEMSSIDAETSIEIGEAISTAGMKYLEAPIMGSKRLAEEGQLLILGAGNRELFMECEDFFCAMSKHAFYVSCEVGKSANINIISSSYRGLVFAALGEILALSARMKLASIDLLEILDMRGIMSPAVLEKGKAIIDGKFKPDTYLKHQQKDLNLGLRMSDKVDVPMPIVAAANESYIRAKGLGLSDYDIAGVYLSYKY